MSINESAAKPIRVMIVDDHKAILWGLERLVESAKPHMMVVATATNRVELLSEAASTTPDVILLDLDLGGENALDALPDLAQQCLAKVLILTGDRDPVMHQTAILKGARGVIGKDQAADILLKAIERIHAGEVWIDRMLMSRVLNTLSSPPPVDTAKSRENKKIASLTAREREIVRAVVVNRGAKSNAIAETLNISEHTLRNHLTVIYEKLSVRNRIDLFAYATEHGLDAV